MQYESERIEYKSQMIDDIYKEVIAFANTERSEEHTSELQSL